MAAVNRMILRQPVARLARGITARHFHRDCSHLPQLSAAQMTIQTTDAPKAIPAKEGIPFGKVFADHMLEIDWSDDAGWHAPVIKPYQNFSVSPAAMVLHYAIECFEGMKAYKDVNGKIRLFRPDCNMERLNNSMARLFLPQVDSEQMIECIKQLVQVDERWIPEGEGYSLYLRPTAIALDPFLGLQVANNVKLYVISCPVGPYYESGFEPVKLYADHENIRAWPGGVGSSKVGGNYGPTISPQMKAQEKGCAQVLWLFPHDGDHCVTEVGAMNVFFVIETKDGQLELITAPLTTGDILPGVTRRSVLELARADGKMLVSERHLGMQEIIQAEKEGRLREAFGAGTAAVIAPIKGVHYKDQDIVMPTGEEIGPVAKHFWDTLMGIQYGKVDHPWSVLVN